MWLKTDAVYWSRQRLFDASFKTNIHVRPRLFLSNSATGSVKFGRINESLISASKRGESIATSYEKDDSSTNQELLDALKKAGFPIPNINIEAAFKQAEQAAAAKGVQLDLDKHIFYGQLQSSRQLNVQGNPVPAVIVDFGITSGVEADLLVYKPESMEAPSAPVAAVEGGIASSIVAASPKMVGAVENYRRQTALGGIFIPKHRRDRVQAFVNNDNDDKDGEYDIDDKEVKGEDDMVKVVLRAKLTTTFTAKAKFEVSGDDASVKVWKTKDKKVPFDELGEEIPITKNFVQGPGGFRVMNLYVEGIKAHQTQRAVKFKYSYWDKGDTSVKPPVEEEFEMTILGLKKIEWKGRKNSFEDNDDLDVDVNHRNPNDKYENSENPEWVGRTMPEKCGGSVKSSLEEVEAVRVFPGKRFVSNRPEARPRDLVNLVAELTVDPVEPVAVHFRSFDVDDPSVSDGVLKEADPEDSQNDNRGRTLANNSPAGYLVREDAERVKKTTFSSRKAEMLFRVTMQPGDNFRVAASSDRDHLLQLVNDDSKQNIGSSEAVKNAAKQRILDKFVFEKWPQNTSKAQIPDHEEYLSNVLTVWRKFHVETDYMDTIGENKIRGTIKKVKADTPRISWTTLTINESIVDKYKEIATNVSVFNRVNGVENAFQEGKLRIRGQEWEVAYNTAKTGLLSGSDEIVVVGDVPESVEGSTFFMWDEDQYLGFRKGMNLRDVKPVRRSGPMYEPIEDTRACTVAERYLQIYIVPDFETLKATNATPTVPFVRNVRATQISADKDDYKTLEHYKFDNKAYHNDSGFWTVYLLFGYRGATYEDGDPDGVNRRINYQSGTPEGAIEGYADLENQGAMVFLEGVVERNGGYQRYNGRTGEEDCIAHEIGHVFGAQHPEKGLMGGPTEQTSTTFSGKSVNTIRSAKNP